MEDKKDDEKEKKGECCITSDSHDFFCELLKLYEGTLSDVRQIETVLKYTFIEKQVNRVEENLKIFLSKHCAKYKEHNEEKKEELENFLPPQKSPESSQDPSIFSSPEEKRKQFKKKLEQKNYGYLRETMEGLFQAYLGVLADLCDCFKKEIENFRKNEQKMNDREKKLDETIIDLKYQIHELKIVLYLLTAFNLMTIFIILIKN